MLYYARVSCRSTKEPSLFTVQLKEVFNMADISSILTGSGYNVGDQDDDQDDDDYGGYYEPSILDQVNPDDLLSPIEKMKKYCISENIFTRQMVARSVVETIQSVATENDCQSVLQIIHHLSDDIEPSVRAELMEQLPSVCMVLADLRMASEAVPNYILPVIVRYLTDQNNQVRKLSQTALLQLMEQDLVRKEDIEKQVCPTLIQLTEPDSGDDFRTEAVALMTKMTTFVGADITERLFLNRFGELCSDPLFHIRKVCASNFGDIATVVGQDITEKILLHLFAKLCQDGVWGVRKACAETFMGVSGSCSRSIRYEQLSPLFVNLLCDKSRWVQMAAYQALGQFIATFHDPSSSGYEVTEEGILCPFQGVMTTAEPSPGSNTSNEEREECEVESQHSLSSDVTNTKVRDVQGTDVSQPAEEAGSKNKNCECVNRTLEDQTSNPSEVAEADKECNIENKEKSISSRSKEDSCSNCIPTRDKDEEPEFNSFLYWKTPLPDVDLSSDVLVENLSSDSSNQNELSPIKNDATAPALHITDHDRSGEVALLAKQLSQTSFSDMDLEEEINLNSNVELGNGYEERYKISNQNVLPPSLLEHYVSMTEPTKAQTIDTELPRHCAFTLPGVILALGKDNWHCVKDTFEMLASDMQWKVRRTLAFSIHDLAVVLGEDITVSDLMPIFNGFLKDLDEVRVGVLKHLYDFIKLLPSDMQKEYLPCFGDFLNPDNTRNWRFRQDLGEQLILLSELYDAQEINDYISPIALALVGDKVAEVRRTAFRLLAIILTKIRAPGQHPHIAKKLVTDIVSLCTHHHTWIKRKACTQICQMFLEENTEDPADFAADFLPCLLQLATDPVPNIRLLAAKVLMQFSETDYFLNKSEDDEQREIVMKALDVLKTDDDRDVRYFAGGKIFEEINLADVSPEDTKIEAEHNGLESKNSELTVWQREPASEEKPSQSNQDTDNSSAVTQSDLTMGTSSSQEISQSGEILYIEERLESTSLDDSPYVVEEYYVEEEQENEKSGSQVIVEEIIEEIIEQVEET